MSGPWIEISLAEQRLYLRDGAAKRAEYPVSTSAVGPDERHGSGGTPRGRHVVRAMIGADAPLGTVFVARRRTGECYSEALAAAEPDRDWILTRILWLSGCEPGRNRLGEVDTMRRFIYIHGCPESAPMGTPASHGCIRMRNAAVAELFDAVRPGTPVEIHEDGGRPS